MIKKANLDVKAVKHAAALACLELTEEEVEMFQKQLSEVLEYFNKLQELDTRKVAPTSQVANLENVFREDRVTPSLSQEETLANTKSSYKGYFKVKAIF